MLQQVVSDRVTGSGQLVLSLMQQSQKFVPMVKLLRAGRNARTIPYTFFCPSAAQEGGIFIKSIKEVWPLDKCAFAIIRKKKLMQSI